MILDIFFYGYNLTTMYFKGLNETSMHKNVLFLHDKEITIFIKV